MHVIRYISVGAAIALHGLVLASLHDNHPRQTLTASGGTGPISVSMNFSQAHSKAHPPVQDTQKEVIGKAITSEAEPIKTQTTTATQAAAQKPLPATQQVTKKTSNKRQEKSQKKTQKNPKEHIKQQTPPSNDFVAASSSRQSENNGVHREVISQPIFAAPPIPPIYPKVARKRGQQGTVWLDIWLDEDGGKKTIKLFKSSGIAILDRSAIKAVKQWLFKPNTVDGSGQESHLRIPVEFSLD